MKKDFIIDDVLGFGWRVMKNDLGYFIKVLLIYFGVFLVLGTMDSVLKSLPLPRGTIAMACFTLNIASKAVEMLFGIGLVRIALSFCDQVKPPIETLYKNFDCFWRYVGVQILYGLIVMGGFFLLIVPGIIWAIQFQFCQYFVVEHGLGPIEALKASSRTTRHVKGKLFVFGLLCGLIGTLGLLCLVVGLFAAIPTIIVATALVYRHLAMQTPELAEFGIQFVTPEPVSLISDSPLPPTESDPDLTPPPSDIPPTDPLEG